MEQSLEMFDQNVDAVQAGVPITRRIVGIFQQVTEIHQACARVNEGMEWYALPLQERYFWLCHGVLARYEDFELEESVLE